MSLSFELNLHYIPKKQSSEITMQDVEMSCSYGMISLTDLLVTGQKSINLEGGEPSKSITIKKEDIRTDRKGVLNTISKAITKIVSCLKISTVKVEQNNPDMMVLPKNILFHKYAVPLYNDYL